MKIDDLTIGEAKQLAALFNQQSVTSEPTLTTSLVGQKVIIRTYSAGVHFGELIEKAGKEVILKDARRLWYWKTANRGISLSEVANEGVESGSKICEAVELQWLDAIEIIPCTKKAIKNIEGQPNYKA
jgi:hypothetical protein